MVKTAAGGGQGDAPKKITRANEAKTEAFLSPEEKAGTNPLKDPMAIIGIVGIVGVPALIPVSYTHLTLPTNREV